MVMSELSLHILDIAQNSITAAAQSLYIAIRQDSAADMIYTTVSDDGAGMDEEELKKAVSPFHTGRKSRKIGLGIPFIKQEAELCGGKFSLSSKKGEGTKLEASFRLSSIDRPPLDNMADTVCALICANPDTDITYEHTIDGKGFVFSTKQLDGAMRGDIVSGEAGAAARIREHLIEAIQAAGTQARANSAL